MLVKWEDDHVKQTYEDSFYQTVKYTSITSTSNQSSFLQQTGSITKGITTYRIDPVGVLENDFEETVLVSKGNTPELIDGQIDEPIRKVSSGKSSMIGIYYTVTSLFNNPLKNIHTNANVYCVCLLLTITCLS